MNKIISYSLLAILVTGGLVLLMATANSVPNEAPPTTKEVIQKVATAEPAVKGLTSFNLTADNHSFGEVKLGETAKHTFWITNTGDEDLIIESVRPSCSCTASNYSKEPVAPGEKGYIEVVYPAKKLGVFRKTATITANTDPRNKILTISGEVIE